MHGDRPVLFTVIILVLLALQPYRVSSTSISERPGASSPEVYSSLLIPAPQAKVAIQKKPRPLKKKRVIIDSRDSDSDSTSSSSSCSSSSDDDHHKKESKKASKCKKHLSKGAIAGICIGGILGLILLLILLICLWRKFRHRRPPSHHWKDHHTRPRRFNRNNSSDDEDDDFQAMRNVNPSANAPSAQGGRGHRYMPSVVMPLLGGLGGLGIGMLGRKRARDEEKQEEKGPAPPPKPSNTAGTTPQTTMANVGRQPDAMMAAAAGHQPGASTDFGASAVPGPQPGGGAILANLGSRSSNQRSLSDPTRQQQQQPYTMANVGRQQNTSATPLLGVPGSGEQLPNPYSDDGHGSSAASSVSASQTSPMRALSQSTAASQTSPTVAANHPSVLMAGRRVASPGPSVDVGSIVGSSIVGHHQSQRSFSSSAQQQQQQLLFSPQQQQQQPIQAMALTGITSSEPGLHGDMATYQKKLMATSSGQPLHQYQDPADAADPPPEYQVNDYGELNWQRRGDGQSGQSGSGSSPSNA